MPFLFFLLIALVAFAIYRNVQQTRASKPIVVPPLNRPIPPRHQRVSDEELNERVSQLRQAVADGSIPLPDAVDSLVRTCGIEAKDAEERLH